MMKVNDSILVLLFCFTRGEIKIHTPAALKQQHNARNIWELADKTK